MLKVLVNGPESTVTAATFILYVVYGFSSSMIIWVWLVISCIWRPVNASVTIIWYSLMTPLWSCRFGGSQVMLILVGLRAVALGYWGGLSGADEKMK